MGRACLFCDTTLQIEVALITITVSDLLCKGGVDLRLELLRATRKKRGLTLAQLSEQTGYTSSFLSQLERGLKQPSLDALRNISNCLGLSLISVLDEGPQSAMPAARTGGRSRCSIVRHESRRSITLPEIHTQYQLITPQADEMANPPALHGFYLEVDPGTCISGKQVIHDYDECCYVLSGRMRAHIGEETYIVNTGDSIYVTRNTPHDYCTIGEEKLVLIGFQSPRE